MSNPISLIGYAYADLNQNPMFWGRRSRHQSSKATASESGGKEADATTDGGRGILSLLCKDGKKGAKDDPVTLLVIQSDKTSTQDPAYCWNDIFSGYELDDGRKIRVVQTGWDKLMVRGKARNLCGVC